MDQFVDLLRGAQGGQALENVARFYGLSAQQALKVAETMTPAFAEAFRQVTQSPDAMASLMALMTSGPYGALYNQPAAPGELNAAGTDALNAVFGSSEVSRAVATQVAASTGLGVAVVKQMLPTYATLMVGGLAKSLAASGALQQMLAAVLSRMPGQTEARSGPIPTGNPWVDAFAAFTASASQQGVNAFAAAAGNGGRSPAAGFTTGNPWADAFAQMMFQRPAPAPAPKSSGNPWQDVVNAMAQTMAQAAGTPEPAKPKLVPPPPPPAPAALAAPAASGTTPNPLAPFQEFFTKMFAQGFPPAFPGASTEGLACTIPEFWLRMMTPPAQGGAPGSQRQGGAK